MKQKVVTKAIIESNNRVLLLRRLGGRPSIRGQYELPGGRIFINQQPEDALAKGLKTHIGINPDSAELDRVMTYIDPDDRELQYIFIVYRVKIGVGDSGIRLSGEYDKYSWESLSDIQLNSITQSTRQILGLETVALTDKDNVKMENCDDENTTSLHLIGHCDGGSRGNPGPAASGFVLLDHCNETVFEGGEYLGIATNNVAEYHALQLALEKAIELGATKLDMKLDSQLVVNQMNGLYKVKSADLQPIYMKIKELARNFEEITFTHVLREYNTLADGMVNKILDEAELA